MPPTRRPRRGGRLRCALLLLLPVLAACAATPPPRRAALAEPPLSYPPAARERLLRIALAEWAEWGSVVVEADSRPGSTRAEALPANFPRVLAYWRAVPEGGAGAITRNRGLYAESLAGTGGGTLWAEPYWSAAFVSYLMSAAGVDAREFPPSAAHSTYVDAMIADARAYPATAPFVPHAPAEYAPAPGDLVCADRGREPIRDWRERAVDAGRFRPMHCDVVVATAPGAVEAVGGNVVDSVTRSRFAADLAGRLLPRPPGAPVWFAVFENRLGRLPPWSTNIPEPLS